MTSTLLCRKCILNISKHKSYRSLSKDTTWQSVVGLEIHAQLDTKSKLFSGSRNSFGGVVNDYVSLFDASIPGTLPSLNKNCVKQAALTALSLSCRINEISTFDRKHYFYADLPTGYQITQQRKPLAEDGVMNFQVTTPGIHKKPYSKSSKIKQIQLEQDSGKSLHDVDMRRSLIDLNRAGVPLMEIVFEPDLQDGEEAAALVRELILIVQKLGTCSGRMEEGCLRVDANVSINRPGRPLSTRTEIKNIGSVRGVAGAIKYEIDRQIKVVDSGGVVVNETRAWDAETGTTVAMRDKEVVQDYRYMPESNLPPLRVNLNDHRETSNIISILALKEKIPELPQQSRDILINEYKLRTELAISIVNETKLLDYFKILCQNPKRDPQRIANVLINDLLMILHSKKIDPSTCEITSNQLGEVIDLLKDKKIDLKIVRLLLEEILDNPNCKPLQVVEEKSWLLVTDLNEIELLCKKVLDENPKLVLQYHNGKTKVFKHLLGIISKNYDCKYDMASVSKIMIDLLKK